jgi:hypothetical protein
MLQMTFDNVLMNVRAAMRDIIAANKAPSETSRGGPCGISGTTTTIADSGCRGDVSGSVTRGSCRIYAVRCTVRGARHRFEYSGGRRGIPWSYG